MRISSLVKFLASLVPMLVLMLAPLSLQAQVPANSVDPKGAPGWKGSASQGPCWKQVGISPAVMKQEKTVKEHAQAQIQAVCSDSSLSDRQRKEKIRQIRVAAHQQLAGLFTTEQRIELETCRAAQRRETGNMPTTPPPTSRDPCAASKPSTPLVSTEPNKAPAAQPSDKPAEEPRK